MHQGPKNRVLELGYPVFSFPKPEPELGPRFPGFGSGSPVILTPLKIII